MNETLSVSYHFIELSSKRLFQLATYRVLMRTEISNTNQKKNEDMFSSDYYKDDYFVGSILTVCTLSAPCRCFL